MTIRFLIVTLAAPICLVAGEPDGAKGRVARESLVLVREEHPYKPTVPRTDEEIETADLKVVKMDPFVVDNTRLLREIGFALDERDRKLKAEKFTPTKGGLFFKNERLDLGISKYEDLIKDSSASTHPVATPEYELLRFKF